MDADLELRKERAAAELFRDLFGANENEILMAWGRYRPSSCKGVAQSFDHVFETVMFARVEVCFHANYVEIFPDAPTLRIFRNTLRPETRAGIDLIERCADEFFREKLYPDPIQGWTIHRAFRYNRIADLSIDRGRLLGAMIYKALMVCLERSGRCYIECLKIVRATLRAIVSLRLQAAAAADRRSDRTAELRSISEIAQIMEFLRDASLSQILASRLNTYVRTDRRDGDRHDVVAWYEDSWETYRADGSSGGGGGARRTYGR